MMTKIYPSPGRARVGATRGVLVAIFGAIQRLHRRRATIRLLEGLSDEALKDIGLHRSEIRSSVHHPLERFPRLRLDI